MHGCPEFGPKDLIDESPQGDEVAPNVHFLGHYGVASLLGLKARRLKASELAQVPSLKR